MTFNQSNHNAGDVHNHPGPEAPMAKAAAETETGRTLVRNPEAVAMDKIATILEPLGEDARRRVMSWVNSVYYPPTHNAGFEAAQGSTGP